MPTSPRRVLVHAPRGRDAEVIQGVLQLRGLAAELCQSRSDLLEGLKREGAEAAIVTEEEFTVTPDSPLHEWLGAQPSWSDFPFIVLTTRHTKRRSDSAQASLRAMGNVVLLERPVNADTLASAAEAAVRGRERQYATRRHLEELDQARATVDQLNRQLEDRIVARTRELAGANDRLMSEIAERERVQAALVQVQKMEAIGRLTGGIAHDFNNLLHVVSMNLELLARIAPEPKVEKIASQARRAVGRGSKLTGQLLSFARAQSLLPRMTDVNALLVGMQELIAVSAGTGVRLAFELCEGEAWAKLDPSQLEMAILNLVVNAKDATGGQGFIRITTRVREPSPASGEAAESRQVVVAVQDDGAGIPKALLTKVFDPFFTTKPVGSGTGLGLSQVYGFAQQSGGSTRIASEPGKGTVVEVSFPLVDAHREAEPADIAEDGELPVSGQRRILVIEDDEDVRRVIVESLQQAGHSVTAAADGAAGLARIAHSLPELVIVDYAMPGMNGAEVIRRAREWAPDLPFILATGYADMVEVGRILGTRSILTKPFDIGSLLRAVAEATQPLRGEPVGGRQDLPADSRGGARAPGPQRSAASAGSPEAGSREGRTEVS
ncbi:Histidine kinase [Burkholderiales bacterium 8X]|nr:Histidine kinase [Burkholderiales bacterium 8X]